MRCVGPRIGGTEHPECRVSAAGVVEELDESWIAVASSIRVFQRLQLQSLTCIRPQKDSTTIALSYALPTAPIGGAMLAPHVLAVEIEEGRPVGSVMEPDASGSARPRIHRRSTTIEYCK